MVKTGAFGNFWETSTDKIAEPSLTDKLVGCWIVPVIFPLDWLFGWLIFWELGFSKSRGVPDLPPARITLLIVWLLVVPVESSVSRLIVTLSPCIKSRFLATSSAKTDRVISGVPSLFS